MDRCNKLPAHAARLALVTLLAVAAAAPAHAQERGQRGERDGEGPSPAAPALGTPVPSQALGEPLGEEAGDGTRGFLQQQLLHPRVVEARDAALPLGRLLREKGVGLPPREIFLRVFKHERVLELWARGSTDEPFQLIREYPVCALPGQLGPKRSLGDFQVPEGFYFIDEFNPESSYFLSLRLNYPNLSDRMRGRTLALGGDIYIHGGCETVGCLPVEDRNIKELYWLAVQATEAGQKLIPVHVFPTRMDPQRLRWLDDVYRPEPELRSFWQNIADGYAYFERTHRVPWITVAEDGRYQVPTPPEPSSPDTTAG